jgi:hypothetical protein
MFAAFMPPCIYFCTNVLLYIYNVSRKRLLLFEYELDSNQNHNSIKAFQKSFLSIFENIFGFKIQFKFKAHASKPKI